MAPDCVNAMDPLMESLLCLVARSHKIKIDVKCGESTWRSLSVVSVGRKLAGRMSERLKGGWSLEM